MLVTPHAKSGRKVQRALRGGKQGLAAMRWKDRWAVSSAGAWSDELVNVVMDGCPLIMEVQITRKQKRATSSHECSFLKKIP